MKYKATVKKEKDGGFIRICHGSTYCADLHNLWSAMQLPGHPPYPSSRGARKTGKKGKQRKRGGGVKAILAKMNA